jgi:oligopeptide/dipeptide ABC transporter ATP-binding protein
VTSEPLSLASRLDTRGGDAPPSHVGTRLRVTDLRIELESGGAPIVDDVSFAIGAGEVMGLVGESGSGKSTVALGLLAYARKGCRIAGGRVELDDTDLLSISPGELREARGARIAYVPQDPASALNPAHRVGAQVAEALKVHHGEGMDIDERVALALEEARLPIDRRDRFPHQLSGGQQQRVAIAMAFASRPAVIVLDEPTTGLDVSTQRHILETVKSLCVTHGAAGVHVSHDLATVATLASDVAVMYAGRIVELGPVDDVFFRPVHPYTRGLLSAIPSPDRAEVLVGMRGQPPQPAGRPAGCAFVPRCAFAESACEIAPPKATTVGRCLVRCRRAHELDGAASLAGRAAPQPQRGSEVLLSVRDVSAQYRGTKILHDVSFDVPRNSCVGIVGESGSGKTTLARCIVGLHARWTGAVTFDGTRLATTAAQRPTELLRRVQFVFQNPYTSLNPRKTVGHILAEAVDRLCDIPRQERQQRVRSVLADVSLSSDLTDRYPGALSGGERQRVAIARALVAGPDLLVCDEVTSSLDVSVQATIVEVLRGLQLERGLSMVFITHNLALVRSIAQHCIVLAAGMIVEAGPVTEVLDRPSNPYTAALMADIPQVPSAGGPGLPGLASKPGWTRPERSNRDG